MESTSEMPEPQIKVNVIRPPNISDEEMAQLERTYANATSSYPFQGTPSERRSTELSEAEIAWEDQDKYNTETLPISLSSSGSHLLQGSTGSGTPISPIGRHPQGLPGGAGFLQVPQRLMPRRRHSWICR